MNTPVPPLGHRYAGTDPFGKHIFEPVQYTVQGQMIVGTTLPPTVPTDPGPQTPPCHCVCDTGRMDNDPDLEGQFIHGELVSEISSMTTSPLSVYVDVIELLDKFDGDQTKVWDFLGKLKDLFA